MSNLEHVKILKQGVEVWNAWREENQDIRPDLSEEDFCRVNLSSANLSVATLFRANFQEVDFTNADPTMN